MTITNDIFGGYDPDDIAQQLHGIAAEVSAYAGTKPPLWADDIGITYYPGVGQIIAAHLAEHGPTEHREWLAKRVHDVRSPNSEAKWEDLPEEERQLTRDILDVLIERTA